MPRISIDDNRRNAISRRNIFIVYLYFIVDPYTFINQTHIDIIVNIINLKFYYTTHCVTEYP